MSNDILAANIKRNVIYAMIRRRPMGLQTLFSHIITPLNTYFKCSIPQTPSDRKYVYEWSAKSAEKLQF